MKIKIGKLYKSLSMSKMMICDSAGMWGKPFKTHMVKIEDVLVPCLFLTDDSFVYFDAKNMLLLSEFSSSNLILTEIKNESKENSNQNSG